VRDYGVAKCDNRPTKLVWTENFNTRHGAKRTESKSS